MKASAAFILASLIISVSITASKTLGYCEPSAGVKKGDWIEYNISMTGPPLDRLRNLTWYRAEILEVDGASFKANKTSTSVNGTFSSSVWSFNLTGGQLYGWVIIPANLSTGDAFFDAAKATNITIEGEEQKTLLGASRTVTHATDLEKGYKEWDKATGVYVYSIVHTNNYTVTMNAIATNMWSPQLPGQNQIATYQWIAVAIVIAASISFTAMFIARKRRLKTSLSRFLHEKRFKTEMLRLVEEK